MTQKPQHAQAPGLHRPLAISLGLMLGAGALAQGSAAPLTRFEYDAEGNPTRVVHGEGSLNLATRMAYDNLQRLIRQTDPLNAVIELAYNGRTDLRSVTDARRLVTSYVLDGHGQHSQLTSPETGSELYSYDAAGNLIEISVPFGERARFSYDTLNRLTEARYEPPSNAAPPVPPALVNRWIYDQVGAGFSHGVGRLTTQEFPAGTRRYAYDAQGRLTQATQQILCAGYNHSASLQYAYSATGVLSSLTYPSGRVASWTLEDGLPVGLTVTLSAGAAAVPVLQDLRWSAWSRLGRGAQWQGWNWVLQGGALRPQARSHDEWGRLQTYTLGPWERELGYDGADRIVGYTHRRDGVAQPGLDQRFQYDNAGRLTQADVGVRRWSYAYDLSGNRSMHSTPVVASGSYVTAATSNRLLSVSAPAQTLSYVSGGMVRANGEWSAGYDFARRMASLSRGTLSTQYDYDADARRVCKSNLLGRVAFVYGQQGELLGEYDLVSGQALREYLWLGGTTVAMIATAQGGTTPELFHLHADHLDTPRIATDRQGRVRWSWLAEPFGAEAALQQPDASLPALVQPLRFPGQMFDPESGLHYNHHRYYEPRTGRYVQSDPIGLAGGINTYAYVGGNPLSYTDPTGLEPPGGAVAFRDWFQSVWPKPGPVDQSVAASQDFLRNYNDMRAANTIGADKYFHCKANCEAARQGWAGEKTACVISDGREFVDQYLKGDPASASAADQVANSAGRSGAKSSSASCEVVCSGFRPRGLSVRY